MTTTIFSPPRPLRFNFSLNWSWLRPPQTKMVLPSDLSKEQIKDAGIAWELAGYGRGAAVSSLTITIQQSYR